MVGREAITKQVATPPLDPTVSRRRRRSRARPEETFEYFSKTFLRSLPSKAALSSFDYSLGDTDYVNRYLRKAFTRPPPLPPPPSGLPPFITTLLDCQEEDGRWHPTPQVLEVLGGPDLIPTAPQSLGPEVAGWRWTTALVLALLRQEGGPYLQTHERLQDGYLLACSLVSDHIFNMAKDSLPPRHCYYHLEPDLVNEGRWRESAERHMRREGYMAFISETMKKQARCEEATTITAASTTTSDAEQGSTLADYSILLGRGTVTKAEAAMEARLVLEAKERKKALRKKEMWRQEMLQAEYEANQRRGPDLSLLRETWERPVKNSQEFQRLKAFHEQSTKKEPLPWAGRTPAREFVATKATPLAELCTKQPPCSSSVTIRKVRHPPPSMRRGSLGPRENRRRSSLGKLANVLAMHGQVSDGASGRTEDRIRAQESVVQAILKMEGYQHQLRGVLDSCLLKFKTCRVHRERMTILDELTAWLGHYHAPQPGFDDWRGKGCLGLHTVICEVVEAVVKWRAMVEREAQAEDQDKAQEMATQDSLFQMDKYLKNRAKLRAARPPPFLWNGNINILLYLPYITEYLSGIPELRSYYGADFQWRRNPFLRPITLDERAPTPRNTKRMVMIGQQVVEEEVASLVALHQQDQARMDEMNAKIARGGFWWVGYGAGDVHSKRLREAEKVLLEEERIYGKRLDLSYFK